ncbi:cellular tumor antigen p53-like isoform X2 [Toxorhynchites rutilus septentrionalis]|uniref:cellular tumor antigen p53-like isoform X2 n=1 Tax=Toxorhynchites rutilus septentrionalis TaxID=329112 RepID=UPI00247908A5|nr:cellular tumor antigen p53-like isoform X2 [Toxorhynchites rutilus septentrionalis]
MVDSQELNGDYKEEIEIDSETEMFPLLGNSQYELKDLDSQTMELFNSQTYANDATMVLNCGDITTSATDFELPISAKALDSLLPNQAIDLEVYATNIDCKPTTTCLEYLKQFPSLEKLFLPWINFRVNLPSEASDKTSWMYSEKLHKLFVKMGNTCTFNVSLSASPEITTSVRAMVVCSAPEDLHHPVSRCDNHRCSDIQNISDDIKQHIVRCKNEQVEYVGTKDGKIFEDRLAVVIPMGYSGKTGITLEFVCQNSCRNINRRATALVFTLEDESGRILGRETFQIKICTNIKRDKLNEEKTAVEENIRKRKAEPVEFKRGKKLMRSQQHQQQQPRIKEEAGTRRCDIDPVLVQISLPNRRMAKRMLENAIGLVSTAIVHSSDETEKNQLMQFVHDIRRSKSTIGLSNSQSSVDSEQN